MSVGSVVATVAILDTLTRVYNGVRARAVNKLAAAFTANDWASLWCWVAYGVVAFALGLPQFASFFGRVTGSHGFIRFLPVWRAMGTGPFWLWWRALGVYVPLFAASALLLSKHNVAQWQFYAGFTAVFIEANLIIFQPWEMDNTKVFYIWAFGASVFVCYLLRRVAAAVSQYRGLSLVVLPIVALLYVLLTISGVLCCVQETVSNSMMFDLVDVEYARWVRENTSPDAVFLVPSEHYPRHMRVVSWMAPGSCFLCCAVHAACILTCCCGPCCARAGECACRPCRVGGLRWLAVLPWLGLRHSLLTHE